MKLAEFLTANIATVRAMCPPTVIFNPGGTRRSAALAGIDLASTAYPRWSARQMWQCIAVLADAGVQHLVINVAWPGQFAEKTPGYREHLYAWIADGLAGPEAQAQYAQLGAAPALLHADDHSLAPLAGCMWPQPAAPSLRIWWYVCPDPQMPWRALARAAAIGAQTQAAITTAICGMPVPSAGVLISFGKPLLDYGLTPPFLLSATSAYWTQQPGFSLDSTTIRRIIYDHHIRRSTWRQDKSQRYAQVDRLRTIPLDHIVGLGRRIGPFWIADEGGRADDED